MQFYLSMTQRITLLGSEIEQKNSLLLPPPNHLTHRSRAAHHNPIRRCGILLHRHVPNPPLNPPFLPGSLEHNYYRLRKKEGRDGTLLNF